MVERKAAGPVRLTPVDVVLSPRLATAVPQDGPHVRVLLGEYQALVEERDSYRDRSEAAEALVERIDGDLTIARDAYLVLRGVYTALQEQQKNTLREVEQERRNSARLREQMNRLQKSGE